MAVLNTLASVPDYELAGMLKHYSKEVIKTAWALGLHLPGGPTGSRDEVRDMAERAAQAMQEASERLVRYGART